MIQYYIEEKSNYIEREVKEKLSIFSEHLLEPSRNLVQPPLHATVIGHSGRKFIKIILDKKE